MHPQLELLLQIQDLKSQRRELADTGSAGGVVEQEEFHVDIQRALLELDLKIDEMKQELEPAIRARLEKFARGHGRAVVPLIGGTCYGCFTMVPTASMRDFSRNDEPRNCENCGRFLYSVEL